MPDFPILIVNTADVPIGSATKTEAWEQGLIHRIVRIMVFDEHDRMLVQKRSMQMGLYPGCWDNSAAGHVDAGETYEQAALRELEEELGLTGYFLERVDNYYSDGKFHERILKRFTDVYKLVLPDPLPNFSLQEAELSGVRWMAIADIKRLVQDSPELVTDGLEQVAQKYL